MGKAARLQHRVERREPAGIVWPPQFVVALIACVAVCAIVAYLILDRVGTSWVAPAHEGLGGRGAGALVALLLGVLASLPLYVVLGRRLRRHQQAARRR
jgi:protein-S-isoprenylcysteine O-methyltransferase Ste14